MAGILMVPAVHRQDPDIASNWGNESPDAFAQVGRMPAALDRPIHGSASVN